MFRRCLRFFRGLALRHFEDYLGGGEAGPFHYLRRTFEAICGIVDQGGIEVDEEAPLELRGFRYGLGAGGPIEVEEESRLAGGLNMRFGLTSAPLPSRPRRGHSLGEDLVRVRDRDYGLEVDDQPVLSQHLEEPLVPDSGREGGEDLHPREHPEPKGRALLDEDRPTVFELGLAQPVEEKLAQMPQALRGDLYRENVVQRVTEQEARLSEEASERTPGVGQRRG